MTVREREGLYRRFADRSHAGRRFWPATGTQVEAAEAAPGVLWPESYRRFALSCGALDTPSFLDLVVGRAPGCSDVRQFLTPRQSVAETRRWGPEAAGGLVPATGCMGNAFAFRGLSASAPRPDDAPVCPFDREDDGAIAEAPSFDEWLARFLAL
jgi:hypothetical protein